MKVSLTKHGGFAAGIRQQPLSVDSSTLSGSEANELARMVAAAESAPALKGDRTGPAPDAMSYTITIEEDDGKTVVLRASDVTMTSSFADLLQWLERHA